MNGNVQKTQGVLAPTEAAVLGGAQQPQVQGEAPPMSDAPAEQPVLPPGQQIVSKEEKVEYRDQDGNLLDPEMVKELEGKVSFKTRYETRTRMIDANGNEIIQPEDAGVAPPHPDVDNVDAQTVPAEGDQQQDAPASQADVELDEAKEESVEQAKSGEAKPGSEAQEATS